ncbi:hypothetical protein L7F22_017545 [Adiantum nelumboides]|nr:hypothetical protein [Adiantum nelumboides]
MAQAAASRSYKLDKLTDKNYFPWRMTMEIMLQKLDLLKIVDGSKPCPDRTQPANANAVRDWDAHDLNARLELLLHMDDTQKQSVRTLTTANAIWLQLQDTYQQRTVGSQVNNLKALVNMSMQEDQEVDRFIQTWRLKMDDVSLAGLDLPVRVQAILLLAALPSSWQSFTSTQSNVATLSVPTLVPLILQEAALRRTHSSSQPSSSSPMAMYSNPRAPPRQPFRHPNTQRFSRRNPAAHSTVERKSTKPNFNFVHPYSKKYPYKGPPRSRGHPRPHFKGKHPFNKEQAHCASDNSASKTPSEEDDYSQSQSENSDEEDAFLACHSFHSNHTGNHNSDLWVLDTDLMRTSMKLQLTDGNIKEPIGLLEKVIATSCGVQYEHTFAVMDFGKSSNYDIILGRPFMRQLKLIHDWGSDYIYLWQQKSITRINMVDHSYQDVARTPIEEIEAISTGDESVVPSWVNSRIHRWKGETIDVESLNEEKR